MKILKRTYQYVVYIPWKFQPCIFNRFGYKFRTTRPSKFDKIDDISRPEVTSSKQKNVYQIFMIYYQSWKFHENRSNRFREICCTKSGRKIRIITRISLRVMSRSSVLFSSLVLYLLTKYLPVKTYSNGQKVYSPGEPWGPWVYLLNVMDRA